MSEAPIAGKAGTLRRRLLRCIAFERKIGWAYLGKPLARARRVRKPAGGVRASRWGSDT
jgi:hypothetical protein